MLTTQFYFENLDFLEGLFENQPHVFTVLQDFDVFFSKLNFSISQKAHIQQGVFFENKAHIHIEEGAVIESGAFIKGPCYIGKRCLIRHNAYIRENVILSDDVLIGHASEIKDSILLNDAKAPHFNYVGNSILGQNVNLGAGAICSNYRFDHKPILIKCDEKIIEGPTKLGAIIGDDSQVGCNAVLNPGTFLEKKSIIMPNSTIKGFYKNAYSHQ